MRLTAMYERIFPDRRRYVGKHDLNHGDPNKQVQTYLKSTDDNALAMIPEKTTRELFRAIQNYNAEYEWRLIKIVPTKDAARVERELINERGGYYPHTYNMRAPAEDGLSGLNKSKYCRDEDVHLSTFNHYLNQGFSKRNALRKAQEAKQKKKKIWLYDEDSFDSIRKLQESPHNKYDVSYDTLSRRVCDLSDREENEINGYSEIKLPNSGPQDILRKTRVILEMEYLQLPNREKLTDTFEGLIHIVRERKIPTIYGKKIPSRHTIHQRFREYGWSLEQAFEFEVPTNFSGSQKLMSEGYYYFGKPNEKLHRNATPLVCHDFKIIWTSQKALAHYVGKHKTTIQDRIEKGHTPKEILDIYCKNPPPKGHKFLYQLPI